MNPVIQINYNREVTEMFVRMAGNMLVENLLAGPPVLVVRFNGNLVLKQLYYMTPLNGGARIACEHLGEDRWLVTCDDIPGKVEILGPQLNDYLNGDL
jgi:hypothetical protein